MLSSVFVDIGGKYVDDSVLDRQELTNIIFRRLSFRLESVRQSEQAELIAKTANITLASGENTVDLTDLYPDFVIPLWAEYKSWAYLQNPVFVFLPTVHLSMLAKKRAMAEYACSFYGAQPRQVIMETSLYGNEVFSPAATLRVFYSPTIPFPETLDETIDLPENLINMVRYDSVVSALALMQTNATALVDKQPGLAKQLVAWSNLYQHFATERAEFQHYFDKWRDESRGSHRPRRRGDILANAIGRGQGIWTVRN